MKHNAEKTRKIEKSRTKTPCHVLYALWKDKSQPRYYYGLFSKKTA